jgi:ribosomal protein L7Ae-like RNA K-turn-binding protein
LAEVFGVLEELCTEEKIPYKIVHSQTWKSALNIKGADRTTQKKNAQEYVLKTYDKKVSQDESDAICIGTSVVKEEKSAF